ncbi:hypothetical protein C8R47DRAFT_1315763 [Mycena vitilis]|nr:hypothetical protein C8R47DRAFT_1315763 [Mycena vitilis]
MNGVSTKGYDAMQNGCNGGDRILRLHIVIVGGGIGGLSAAYCLGRPGHRITVLERASEIADVGGGIQVGPNFSRLLLRWGLEKQLEKVATKPEAITFLRYSDGERIGWTKWGSAMERDYGASYYHIHVLGILLGQIAHRGQLGSLLCAYQEIRHTRTRETQLAALANHHIFHLEDGPAQQTRDDSMRAAMESALAREQEKFADGAEGNANVWADRKKSQSQFGYDAEADSAHVKRRTSVRL